MLNLKTEKVVNFWEKAENVHIKHISEVLDNVHE